MSLKFAAAFLILLWQAAGTGEPPVARPDHMRYERAIQVAAGSGQACAVLDGQIFPHAEPSLKDVRVFNAQGGTTREVPYAITLSETVTEETQPARVLNLGMNGKTSVVFDIEMPDRAYTDVMLDLVGQDFLATATVSGMDALGGGKTTALGVFTLFDLSSQRLSRDTTLPLQESTFRYLHVVLAVSPAPGARGEGQAFVASPAMVVGAKVPPSREAQTVYSTVASTSVVTTGALAKARETRFDIALPLRVPVERVSFDIAPGFTGNFSRDVRINASPVPASPLPEGTTLPVETLTGNISRVHSVESGHKINEVQLSVPATLGSNLQTPAKVWVEVENGDDQPVPITAVRLEMRQRKLCFDTPASAAGLALYYGDPALAAPVYDYDRLFTPVDKPLAAELGAEELNVDFHPPPAEVKPFTERHPEVLWIGLIVVICVLGVVALKSSRNIGR